MAKLATITFSLTLLIVFQSCLQRPAESDANIAKQSEAAIDENIARTLSDSMVDDLLNDRRDKLRGKMEQAFRDYYDEKAWDASLDPMFDTFGTPLEAEYKWNEVGRKTAMGGYDKPLRKFWYAVRTTKYERGSNFITVEIVPDNGTLASSGIAIVNFPLGVPDNLR
jgi:hypothetical protein